MPIVRICLWADLHLRREQYGDQKPAGSKILSLEHPLTTKTGTSGYKALWSRRGQHAPHLVFVQPKIIALAVALLWEGQLDAGHGLRGKDGSASWAPTLAGGQASIQALGSTATE